MRFGQFLIVLEPMMDSKRLTPSQARIIGKSLYRQLNYLYRLKTRMAAVGFPPKDPLYLMVCDAYDALHRLSVEIHYMSCSSGAGRPPSKEE